MPEFKPNPSQQRLIDSTEGIYAVNAGAGTGKTFSITRRYSSIVEQAEIEPEDVLLVTFTTSAATEMKERIVEQAPYAMRELTDAPIQTFHSLCHDILDEQGHAAPNRLGLDDYITSSTRVIDNELIEATLFEEFFDRFTERHATHDSILKVLETPTELLSLINKLAAKGIFPTVDGWYRNGEQYLDGDFDAFEEIFRDQNAPRNDGRKQSQLRSNLTSYGRESIYSPSAPSRKIKWYLMLRDSHSLDSLQTIEY